MLFGRKTYELMEEYWPAVARDEQASRNETRQQPETQQLLASLRLLGRNDAPHARETTAAA